jgi:hypothetical protein
MRPGLRILAHVGAFLAAVVVPTLILCLQGGSLSLATLIFLYGIAVALVIALPLFLALKRWHRVDVYTSTLGGLIAAAAPIAFMSWPLRYASLRTNESLDDVVTLVNGVPTAAGWAFYAAEIVRFALLGAIGGLVFWAILKLAGELAPGGARPARARVVATAAVSALAILSAAAILAIPSYTRDRTCHGDARPPLIGPRIDLKVEDSEWPAVSDLLHRYADDNRLSVQDLSEVRPSVRILYLSLCDSETLVLVNEQRWSSQGHRNPMPGSGVGITMYHGSEAARWRSLADDLIERLRARWPDSVTFMDEGGRHVSAPPELPSRAGATVQTL